MTDIEAKARECAGERAVDEGSEKKLYADIIAIAREAREQAFDEAVTLVRGQLCHEQFRTWPHWNPGGNRSNEADVTRISDAHAAAILALKDRPIGMECSCRAAARGAFAVAEKAIREQCAQVADAELEDAERSLSDSDSAHALGRKSAASTIRNFLRRG